MNNREYKLSKGTIRYVNKMYNKKHPKKQKSIHDIIIEASGIGAFLVDSFAILCMETYTKGAFIVASVSTAYLMLFMLVNADVINKRIMRYWRKKTNDWV